MWQWKERGYLFPAANLAKVFRGKWLQGMRRAGLTRKCINPKGLDCAL